MQETVRVAMLIQAYLPHVGGAERQLAALAPLLSAQGVEVMVLTRRYQDWKPFEMIDEVPVYRLPIPGPKAAASLSYTVSGIRLLGRLRPDVIHAHELLSPATTAILARRLYRIPVVAKVLRGGAIGDLAKLRRNRLLGQLRLLLLRQNIDAFIAISEEIERELEQTGVGGERRFRIPNGVDTTRFAPLDPGEKAKLRAKLGLPHGPLALFTGRLVPEKRLDQLVEIWSQVRSRHPQATLIIAGDGPEASRLKAQAGPGVHMLGLVEDVRPYLQTADLFVLPSAYEGLSNALLEAMAAALPVVATAVGGARDLIRSRENGWLVPPDRPEELKAALLSILSNPQQAALFGRQARQTVIEAYSLETTARKLRELYGRLLEDRRSIRNANHILSSTR